MKNKKQYDFEVQADEALLAEAKLKDILISKKFELKTERVMWHDSGNIVIEYESYNKPSGIAATEADYWAHELRSRENETLAYLIFPTPILRKLCNDLLEQGDEKESNWRRGGENQAMEMILLDLEKLLTKLRNFSGAGDKEFLTRKARRNAKSNL